jgi:hypothetical protein
MARIQYKRSGRKPPSTRIGPLEIRHQADAALAKRGIQTQSWRQQSQSRKPNPAPEKP